MATHFLEVRIAGWPEVGRPGVRRESKRESERERASERESTREKASERERERERERASESESPGGGDFNMEILLIYRPDSMKFTAQNDLY